MFGSFVVNYGNRGSDRFGQDPVQHGMRMEGRVPGETHAFKSELHVHKVRRRRKGKSVLKS